MKPLSARTGLLIIFALFGLPLLLAWLMYSGVLNYRPSGSQNLGALVQPPLPLPWDAFELPGDSGGREILGGHWVILYPLNDPCHEFCRDQLAMLRQIHRASGRHQDRLRIALVSADFPQDAVRDSLLEIYPRFILVKDASNLIGESLLQAQRKLGETAQDAAGIFVLDPLGNIMMFYKAEVDPIDIKTDLKRLLTYSKLDDR
jgi:cytochrome oxidase Cu insertion factor (SCO1/SenC/PrrC family)